MGFAALYPSYEPVNLSILSILDVSQIKDLAPPKILKIELIHKLYAPR